MAGRVAGGAGRLTKRRLSEAEFDARVPVWTALANLFLDTTHSPAIRKSLADDLIASELDLEKIEEILRNEVAPVFGVNLLSVAGEWALWDEDEVRTMMHRHFRERSGPSLLSRIQGRLTIGLAQREWKKVRALIELGSE